MQMSKPHHLEKTNCNLCNADSPVRMYKKFDVEISKCRNCDLVYTGPWRPNREASWLRYNPNYFWDEYLPSLGVVNGEYDLAAFDARYAPMLATIAPYQKESTLLEIGCGGAFFLKAAERAGWKSVAGVEVSEAAVTFNQSKLGLDVRLGTIEEVKFPKNRYDVVAMFDTIEHLFDPKHILTIAFELLRPGGVLVLSTPNINALSRHALGISWAVLSPYEHLYYFSPSTLTAMLENSGYTNINHLRMYGGQGLFQTMNPAHNQAPKAPRTILYSTFVRTAGIFTYKKVQQWGIADELYFMAEKP
jgi:2-polyprenyl-3-methyl-5-hydroxy-6-metoxy-1,4-benzoquinol methylase